MLLLDGLLNFSKVYIPSSRGGLMDTPLVLTTRLDPNEIDKEAHNVDCLREYPIELYEAAMQLKDAKDVEKLMDLGRALHSMVKEKGLSMAMVPGTPKYIDGISYWLPDITDLRELMVKMQGATMTEHYKSAAELMEKEYNNAVEKVEKGDDSEENKEAVKEEKELKAKKEEKAKEEKKKQADKDKDAGKNTASQEASSDSRGVVRLVNCSGSKTAGADAAARLRNAGFEVISGGSGDVIANTVVISTTNNGAVVNRLSNVPFAHQMRISRDGAADCDGVVMLGADFK